MNAIIITDYFRNSGLGNYLRSKYLYNFIKKKKLLKIDFLILSKLKKKNFRYNIIILDLPNNKYNLKKIVKKFKKKNCKVIALDYISNFKIDCNIALFKKNKFAKVNYVGLKYSIIRKEFLNYKVRFIKDLFFISIGSSDIKNIKYYVKKIFSPYFKKFFLNSNLENINQKLFQKKYLKQMASCKMAASNGGTTLLELIFLRKIVFVYPQNLLELRFANYIKRKGYLILINKFKINKNLLIKLNSRSQKRKDIDSLGAYRIYKVILSYYNSK